MIKFFRKIRKRLLSENRFNKYLIYALGEIILVVIGILIALQINNWNESKLDRKYELKMLSEISSSLKDDIDYFDKMVEVYDELYETADYFMVLSKTNVKFHDSLMNKVFDLNKNINFQYNSGPYEALKSSGIDKISNDSIRSDITSLFDFELPKLGNNIKHITRNHQKNIEAMLELFGDRYVDDSRGTNFVGWSNVSNDLFQSQGFLQILAGVSWRARNAANQLRSSIPDIQKTLNKIDAEIERNKNRIFDSR